MMKFLFVTLMAFLFIIILTANAYALRLNEIESNPEGEDSGFEWIELYSEDSVSLEGYVLDHEGRGSPLNLTGNFQGFFVINFRTQWLRNTNETVYLKRNGEIINTAGPFSDNRRNKTYSFCDGEWVFTDATNNQENSCNSSGGTSSQNQQNSNSIDQRITTTQNQESQSQEDVNLKNLTVLANNDNETQQPKKIVLNGKTGEITKNYKTRIAVIYLFIGLCVLLVILIALRRL